MSFYALDDSYSLSDWYQNQGAYDLNAGTDSLLDTTRHILESDAYMFQGVAWPKGDDIFIDNGQTFSGSLNLVPNSYLVSLSGWCGNVNRFTLRIYDKGAQTDLFYGQFGWYPTVISNMTGTFNNGFFQQIGVQDMPFGPYFFQSPLIVLPPGTLQIQLSNVDIGDHPTPLGDVGIAQMLFGMAVPKTTTTLNNRRVQFSQDPSGVNTLQALSSLPTLIGGGL